MSWDSFIKAHEHVLAACDFFTAEVITHTGIVTYYVLFFILIGSRKIHIAGITAHPDQAWMEQTNSPNLNAFAERWVRSVKEECLSKLILFGEDGLRRALTEYTEHYHFERNHQGKGNRILLPNSKLVSAKKHGPVLCKTRLNGLLNFYYRALVKASHGKPQPADLLENTENGWENGLFLESSA